MASARFSRCEQARFWAIAQSAKAVRDLGKSQIDMAFDVFREDNRGLGLGDDALDIGPQVPGIGSPATLPRVTEWLAGITGREDMNAAAPRSAVKGFEIVPYRRCIQGLVRHPRHESGCRVSFPLDVTNSSIPWLGNADAKVEPCISGTE
jgi:hypothetical protein